MTHYYEKNIVDIKNEYTTFLLNILTPLIYEGIKSMYNDAIKYEQVYKEKERTEPDFKNPGVLKIFQTFLKGVQNLNNNNIETEAKRIRDKCGCADWFDDLIKAVVKSNIILLTFNASGKKCKIVNDKLHENINIPDFIHKCYVEASKVIYNFPHLFWHELPSVSIKNNQKEIYEIIKTAIQNAIRKILPIKLILEEYLTNEYVPEQQPFVSMKDLVKRDLSGKLDDEMENQFNENTQQLNVSRIINEDETEELSNKISELEKHVNKGSNKLEQSLIMDETDGQEKEDDDVKQFVVDRDDKTQDTQDTQKSKDAQVKEIDLRFDNKKTMNMFRAELGMQDRGFTQPQYRQLQEPEEHIREDEYYSKPEVKQQMPIQRQPIQEPPREFDERSEMFNNLLN